MMRDAIHDLRIRFYLWVMCRADHVRRVSNEKFMRLCRERSRRQVERMEREKGLV
jgi:hypothetical protein